MLSALAALILLAAMGGLGVAALRRCRFGLQPLEQIVYGLPLGVVVASLVLLLGGIAYGLSVAVVVIVGFLSAAGTVALLMPWSAPAAAITLRAIPERVVRLRAIKLDRGGVVTLARIALEWLRRGPTIVIGLFTLRWVALWDGAITTDGTGIWAGQINIWGDWAQHLGDVVAFASGDNFPPQHPRYAGQTYAYHYLASLTAAAMVKLGMSPAGALTLQSFLFSVLIALGIYAFARRLTHSRAAAALTVPLFLLGSGLGWLLTVRDVNRSHDLLDTLRERPWDAPGQVFHNFRWFDVYFSSIEPQRAFLYGLPLSLLILTFLFGAVRTGERRSFVAAGIVAGLLPFAHLGPLPALAMISVALVALFPTRNWVVFFGPWVVLTVPQMLLQGGEDGTLSSVRWQLGWVASPDPWLWFWLKNLGWFLPLLVLALVSRRVVPVEARRFLWAFMPIFVVANLAVFQPDPWDNVKFLLFWFLGTCILVASLLVKIWREHRVPVVRFLVAGAVATMVLSGLLVNLQQARGLDRYRWLTTEEVDLAADVRVQTPRDAIFAVGLQPNHPVPMLSGRRVVMSYSGWLWPRGIDSSERERDLRAIYAFAPETPDLLRKYDISYVVIGPWERQNFQANEAAFRAAYPVVIETATYEVFAVAPG